MDTGRRHSTFDELAIHHLDRGQVYATIAALLGDAPSGSGVAAARALLRDESRVAQRLTGLAALLFALPADYAVWTPTYDLLCAGAETPSRLAAHTAASLPPGTAKLDDMRALAILARETGRALRRGDVAKAAELNDAQHCFLRGHACECLTALARDLARSSALLYVTASSSLREQLEHDIDDA